MEQEHGLSTTQMFENPLTKGSCKGTTLDKDGFDNLLGIYYEERRWDERGIPRKDTFEKLSLSEVATELGKYVKLNGENM